MNTLKCTHYVLKIAVHIISKAADVLVKTWARAIVGIWYALVGFRELLLLMLMVCAKEEAQQPKSEVRRQWCVQQ